MLGPIKIVAGEEAILSYDMLEISMKNRTIEGTGRPTPTVPTRYIKSRLGPRRRDFSVQ